ncbi:hypothetical protein [uncultured Salegentibacter sp.]|uniref:hypothetical protein n=1 Tax=uncultured Salegentibacter sp. TaxID=259320 RepID=UPI0030D82770
MIDLNTQTILIIIGVVAILSLILSIFMLQVRKLANKKVIERYDFEKMKVELDYMRQNLERQQYELSRKLEENADRWKDINHLILSSQKRSNDFKYQNLDTNEKHFYKNEFLSKYNVENLQIDKNLVFVLTPFNKQYIPSFNAIRDTVNDIGLRCIRGDEQFIDGDLLPHIIEQIAKARFVIANITGRNPNVFYELGIAHALNKPTIIVAENLSDAPVDIQSKYLIIYENLEDLTQQIKRMLTKILLSNT